MTKFLALCFTAMLAGFAGPASAQEKPTLKLVQSIPEMRLQRLRASASS
jgi:hypothetical protein